MTDIVVYNTVLAFQSKEVLYMAKNLGNSEPRQF